MMIRYKKNIIRIVMVIIMIIYIFLYCNRREILRWSIERNLTAFDKKIAVILRDEHGYFARMEENGLLDGKESMVEAERLIEEINANCTEEEIEIYNKILFGGFSVDEYLKNHTYEDLFLLITKLDAIWPLKTTPVMENGNYVYDENGDMIIREERFSFWNLINTGKYL